MMQKLIANNLFFIKWCDRQSIFNQIQVRDVLMFLYEYGVDFTKNCGYLSIMFAPCKNPFEMLLAKGNPRRL